jgi:hypothetical protein
MSELVKELRHLAKEFPAIKYGDEEARSCVEITLTAAAGRIEELEESERKDTEVMVSLNKIIKEKELQ